MTRNIRGRASCKCNHFEGGSIVAVLEVNLTRTHSIRNAEQLKEILLSRQTDENGNIILYDREGNSLSIDPDRLTVDGILKIILEFRCYQTCSGVQN